MAKKTHGNTASGLPITDELVSELAKKAEKGYDVDELMAILEEEPVARYESDLFAFDATAPEPTTAAMRALRDGFAAALAPALAALTGKPIARADMRAFAYRPGHYLLPHTDHRAGLCDMKVCIWPNKPATKPPDRPFLITSYSVCFLFLRCAAHPSLIVCLDRPSASASSGTSSVMHDPAAM